MAVLSQVQGPLDQPPRNPVRDGCLRGGAAGINDRGDKHVPQPAGGAGPPRDLEGGFEERPAGTFGFIAEISVLGPDDLHRAGDGNVPDALPAP